MKQRKREVVEKDKKKYVVDTYKCEGCAKKPRAICYFTFETPIDDIDKTISIVYYVSEIVIITVGILYSVLDVALLMKKIYFRITQRQNP